MDLRIIPSVRHSDPAVTRRKESEKILDLLKRGDQTYNILLDERGKQWSSRGFSQELGRLNDSGHGTVRFIIGGAYGVDERIKSAVDAELALSRMTFPHELVRLVFLEQLYRAFTILRGKSYHHD